MYPVYVLQTDSSQGNKMLFYYVLIHFFRSILTLALIYILPHPRVFQERYIRFSYRRSFFNFVLKFFNFTFQILAALFRSQVLLMLLSSRCVCPVPYVRTKISVRSPLVFCCCHLIILLKNEYKNNSPQEEHTFLVTAARR